MTTIAMALGFAGQPVDPSSLNTFMVLHHDYTADGSVDWPKAVTDFSQGTLQFYPRTPHLSSAAPNGEAPAYLEDVIFNRGYPVIVGVEGDSHYVIVNGKVGSRFTIVDPGYAKTYLDEYPDYSMRGYVAPVGTPDALPSLAPAVADSALAPGIFIAGENADILLTDPLENQTGRLDSGEHVEQIPSSAYVTDNIADLLDPEAPLLAVKSVYLVAPTAGTYQLTVLGTANGPYQVTILPPFSDTINSPVVLLGTAVAGSDQTFTLRTDVDCDLAVTSSVDKAQMLTGETATYTVVVNNIGPGTSQVVTVTDSLPPGALVNNATPSTGTIISTDGILTWAVGDLAPGASATLTFDASVATGGQYMNSVSVASFTHDLAGANNTAGSSISVTTPFQQWKADVFGASAGDESIAGDNADPDHDGLPNLLEYAFGTNALSAETQLPWSVDTNNGFLTITAPKNPAATDVQISAESTGNLSDPNSWSSSAVVILQNNNTIFKARDTIPMSQGGTRFLRLRVTHASP